MPDAKFSQPEYSTPIKVTVEDTSSFNTRDLINIYFPIEQIVAVAFATAISEVPDANGSVLLGSPGPKLDKLYANSEYNFAKYKFKSTQYGWGYINSASSVRLALSVITAYTIITVVYILYLLITGSSSTAWNSAIELVVLALQSRQPGHLGHTSVSIDSMATYQESVGIRVNDVNELELVFARDQDTDARELTQVVPNKSY